MGAHERQNCSWRWRALRKIEASMSLGPFICFTIAALSASFATVNDKSLKLAEEPRYDAATVIDVDATVMDVREVPRNNPLGGVHLTVKIESETIDVYLGPADYLKEFEITFAKATRSS